MAEILQSHAVAHQSLWQGALCSFFLFQACVGVDLLKKIYKSFYEGAGMGAITNPKIAGTAQLLNYLLHSIVATFVGGFAAEIIAFLTGRKKPRHCSGPAGQFADIEASTCE
jgi:hypothetical protein